MARTSLLEFAERFWFRVDVQGDDDCWLWKGAIQSGGYGQASWPVAWVEAALVPSRTALTHRMVLILRDELRTAFSDLNALHGCDVRSCVNPRHLRWGTAKDNIADMYSRGREVRAGAPGERNANAKLNEGAVREIRQRYAAGGIRQLDLAREYGLTQGAVGFVVRRKTWGHVA